MGRLIPGKNNDAALPNTEVRKTEIHVRIEV